MRRTKIMAWCTCLVLGILVPVALTACETTKGVGRDVQDAGEGMEGALED